MMNSDKIRACLYQRYFEKYHSKSLARMQTEGQMERIQTLIDFVEQEEDRNILNAATYHVYSHYVAWCAAQDKTSLCQIDFSRSMVKCGYKVISKKIRGKKFRIFIQGQDVSP